MKFNIKASTYAEFVAKVKAKGKGGSLAFHKSTSNTVTYTDREGARHTFIWVKTGSQPLLPKNPTPTPEIGKATAIAVATVLYLSAIAWVAIKVYSLASASVGNLGN